MLIPFERENYRYCRPYALYLLIGLNVIIYCVSLTDYSALLHSYGFAPVNFKLGTIFSSMFLHSRNPLHLFGNMFFLYMYGDNVEDVLGPWIFFLTYLCCGFFAALTSYMLNMDSSSVYVGASGAISGILGLYLIFFPNVKSYLYFGRIRVALITIKTGLIIWFAQQFIFMMLFEMKQMSSIAYSAHFGGMFFGILFGLIFKGMGMLQKFEIRIKLNNYDAGVISCPCCHKPRKIREYGEYCCSSCLTTFRYSETGVSTIDER
jgi:membrane associated rhomboid family serine protease